MDHKINATMLAIPYLRSAQLGDDLSAKLVAGYEKEAEELIDAVNTTSVGMFTRNVVVRTNFFTKTLEEHSDQFDQLLVLGIGLDTKYDTLSCLDQKNIYAIDIGAQDIRYCYDRSQVETRVHLTTGDLTEISHDQTLSSLIDAGFDRQKKTFIIWEGGTYYLDNPDVWQVISYLDSQINLVGFTFDCLAKDIFADESRSSYEMIQRIKNIFSESQYPWYGFFDMPEIEQFCQAHHFTNVSIIEHGTIEKQFYQDLVVPADGMYFVIALK